MTELLHSTPKGVSGATRLFLCFLPSITSCMRNSLSLAIVSHLSALIRTWWLVRVHPRHYCQPPLQRSKPAYCAVC